MSILPQLYTILLESSVSYPSWIFKRAAFNYMTVLYVASLANASNF